MMGENTKIEWATHTFNPWIGCTKVAAGCEHCYAERDMDKHWGKAKWGPSGTRVKTSAANWVKPLKWNREDEQLGQRQRVFCASLADVFEDWQGPIVDSKGRRLWVDRDTTRHWNHESPGWSFAGSRPATNNDLRRKLFRLIDATPWLDWLLVTKRPENIRKMWPEEVESQELRVESRSSRLASRRSNVWLLTSIATQADADRNIPELLKCRDLVPVLGVSAEPLLGPINLQGACIAACGNGGRCSRDDETGHRIIQDSTEGGMWVECICSRLNGISWVIVGGESGPHARPMHPDWARSIRDQCQAAGVPFFFKQWGEFAPCRHKCTNGHEFPDGQRMWRLGKKNSGRELDGREWNEFPEVTQ